MSAVLRWANQITALGHTRLTALGRRRLAMIGGATAIVIVALILIGGTVGAGSTGGAPASNPGQARPFTLSTLGHPGGRVSLSSLAGQPVIVNFFASWCEPCKRETPMIARFYRASHGHLAIIGIDVNDSARSALAFVRENGVRYPVGVDPLPMKTALSYDLPGLPATFFLDSHHRIVKRIFGAVTWAQLTSGSLLARRR